MQTVYGFVFILVLPVGLYLSYAFTGDPHVTEVLLTNIWLVAVLILFEVRRGVKMARHFARLYKQIATRLLRRGGDHANR